MAFLKRLSRIGDKLLKPVEFVVDIATFGLVPFDEEDDD